MKSKLKSYHIYIDSEFRGSRRVVEKKTKKAIKAHSELNAILRYKLEKSKTHYNYASYIKYEDGKFYYHRKPNRSLPEWDNMFYAKEEFKEDVW